MRKRRVLIALGGNALELPNTEATAENQLKTARLAAKNIVDLIEAGNQVIVCHGNGPQVGRVLLQNAAAKSITPELPLDVCGAMTQGAIGYHIQNAILGELENRGLSKPVVSLVTQVEISLDDKAFENPTKPVGPYYTEAEAKEIMANTDFILKEDSGRGWRRVVPSPAPQNVVEVKSAEVLVNADNVVIVAGGGGIPVVKESNGYYKGIEAVIDKDLSSALLADQLDADDLFILTAVPKVMLNFGKENQESLDNITTSEATKYSKEGHFAPGSMLPKVLAAVNFSKKKEGRRAIITSLEDAMLAFNGASGTTIVK